MKEPVLRTLGLNRSEADGFGRRLWDRVKERKRGPAIHVTPLFGAYSGVHARLAAHMGSHQATVHARANVVLAMDLQISGFLCMNGSPLRFSQGNLSQGTAVDLRNHYRHFAAEH